MLLGPSAALRLDSEYRPPDLGVLAGFYSFFIQIVQKHSLGTSLSQAHALVVDALLPHRPTGWAELFPIQAAENWSSEPRLPIQPDL